MKPLTDDVMKSMAGTKIGACECEGCGIETPVKINKAGCAYTFCVNPLERDENGKVTEKCMTRHNWGRTASKRLVEEYLIDKGEDNAQEFEDRTAETGASEGDDLPASETGRSDKQSGGLFGGGLFGGSLFD